ncbi:hypothetical protein Plhal703r1_c03g0016731 [Plasmopara halstedii]
MEHQTTRVSDLTRNIPSFCMLNELLQSTKIKDDEEAVMVTRMCVDPRHVEEFERLLRMILKATHTVGHVSTCVVRPPLGECMYTSIVKYSKLQAIRQMYSSTVESDVELFKLLAARDSLLLEPPTYQIEAGFGTWIEANGNTKPMRGEDDNLVYQNVPGPCCNDSCENPHGLNVRASFVIPTKDFQLFRSRYQRNNKKGGQKNLRCFPCCRNGRHISSGFCGDSIRVHVAVSRLTKSGGVKICPIQTLRPAVLAFARFLNLDGTFESRTYLFMFGTRGAAMETSSQSAIFEFNAECKAWHYGWTAPRGQGVSGSDAQHVLEVLFMKPMGSYMYCLERLRSDSFSIFSSRRASHAPIKPDTEAYENNYTTDCRIMKRKRASIMKAELPAHSLQAQTSKPPKLALQAQIVDKLASTVIPSSLNKDQTDGIDRDTANTCSKMIDVQPCKMETIFDSVPLSSTTSEDRAASGFDYRDFDSLMESDNVEHTQLYTQQIRHQQQLSLQSQQMQNFQQSQDLQRHQCQQHELLRHQQQLLQQLSEQMMINQQQELQDRGGLANHSLFQEEKPARRVVSTEEVPWSELYNLFDSTPVSQMYTNDDLDQDKKTFQDYERSSSISPIANLGIDSAASSRMASLSITPSQQAVLNYL